MADDLGGQVVEIIARYVKRSPEGISLETTFDELGMTSLDSLGLVYELEEMFNVSIPNEDVLGLRNVRQAVEILERLLPEGGA
ncbi:MAG TPA: acyl carrier protein [Pyrinomonadaceae bacterium]|nr:acyl carrier protein [Pyrinomonadaceae bacterium]